MDGGVRSPRRCHVPCALAFGGPRHSSRHRFSRVLLQAESLVIDGVSHGFKLKFFFDTNPYFTNEVRWWGLRAGRQGSALVLMCPTRESIRGTRAVAMSTRAHAR